MSRPALLPDQGQADYVSRNRERIEELLGDAVDAVMRAEAADPIAFIADHLAQAAARAKVASHLEAAKQCDAANKAARAFGALTHHHHSPRFEFLDTVDRKDEAVVIKEVKLPRAAQTHEVVFEPVSRCIFATQMSNSVLVRVPIGNDGLMIDDQMAWRIGDVDPASGDGISGLHNATLSHRHHGCLWLSLQFANTLLLVDGTSLVTKQVLQVPTLMPTPEGGMAHVGGPHAVCECVETGDIWVALKGSVACHPCAPRPARPHTRRHLTNPPARAWARSRRLRWPWR